MSKSLRNSPQVVSLNNKFFQIVFFGSNIDNIPVRWVCHNLKIPRSTGVYWSQKTPSERQRQLLRKQYNTLAVQAIGAELVKRRAQYTQQDIGSKQSEQVRLKKEGVLGSAEIQSVKKQMEEGEDIRRIIKKQLEEELLIKIRKQLEEQIRKELEEQIRKQLEEELRIKIRKQLEDQLAIKIRKQVGQQLGISTGEQEKSQIVLKMEEKREQLGPLTKEERIEQVCEYTEEQLGEIHNNEIPSPCLSHDQRWSIENQIQRANNKISQLKRKSEKINDEICKIELNNIDLHIKASSLPDPIITREQIYDKLEELNKSKKQKELITKSLLKIKIETPAPSFIDKMVGKFFKWKK